MVVCILQRPSCTTSGMPVPAGTLVSVKLPSGPVMALAIEFSAVRTRHLSQTGPSSVNGGSFAPGAMFGM